MNDTYVTVTGNIVTKPERRRVESTGATVVNFRLGSTARRFDKGAGGWVDGNTFFVKVSCWRGLADNAYQSLFKGDPVVVTGRLYTREYEAEDGTRRVSYELEATALGHNLARGTSTFARVRPAQPAGVSDAAEAAEQPDHEDEVLGDAEDRVSRAGDRALDDDAAGAVSESGSGERGPADYPFARLDAVAAAG